MEEKFAQQTHLWNLGPGYHAGRLEELLSSTGHVGPEEDVKDSVLPRSYWQAWWNWESTKKEFETMATKVGVIWFVEVVKRTLEVVCRDFVFVLF